MIVYDPLWKTLKKNGLSTYQFRHQRQYGTASEKDMSVSTNTLDDLCKLIGCNLSDVAEFVEDEE